MIRHIPFASLYFADHGWLKSRFHFSFAEYRNPDNIHYGPLRVMNDDIIEAGKGFGTHPHENMEIISYVLRGALTHKDSMGNKESLGRGGVQYMSAGTGVMHSETNEGGEAVHLIQTWIIPAEKGLEPQYGSKVFDKNARHNRWLHLAGPEESEAAIHIYQDANMYVSEIDAGQRLPFALQKGRRLYLKVMEGSGTINGTVFAPGDAAEVEGESVVVEAITDLHLLLVEMRTE
ncbi:pirin family protein [Sulfurimonas sp. HSL3-7]|uniref:pirin family protein n=1 Tax=Sulfonitrofixus jiaomeiensis TaxID=3131938 RepID=UPI0031F7C617